MRGIILSWARKTIVVKELMITEHSEKANNKLSPVLAILRVHRPNIVIYGYTLDRFLLFVGPFLKNYLPKKIRAFLPLRCKMLFLSDFIYFSVLNYNQLIFCYTSLLHFMIMLTRKSWKCTIHWNIVYVVK